MNDNKLNYGIYFKTLTLILDKNIVIDQFTLSIARGARVAVLGTENSGKSFLLKTLIGMIRPTMGEAGIMDFDSVRQSLDIRKICGYVPDEPGFDLFLTVNDLFHFSNDLRKEEVDWDFIQSLVERFKIDPRKKIGQLNIAEQKLLSVVLALMHRPKVLLMEDPSLGLDEDAIEQLVEVLEETQEAMTLLVTTADIKLASQLCRRVVLLEKGKLLSIVDSDKLLSQIVRKVEVTFAAKPAMDQLLKSGLLRQLSWEGATLKCLLVGTPELFIKFLQASDVLDYKSYEANLDDIIQAIYLGENNA